MADTTYIWKGPATTVEVWTEGAGEPALIFSGQVTPGAPIGMPLPADHTQVKGWLAFRLIEEAPALAVKADTARPDTARADIPADINRKKERADG